MRDHITIDQIAKKTGIRYEYVAKKLREHPDAPAAIWWVCPIVKRKKAFYQWPQVERLFQGHAIGKPFDNQMAQNFIRRAA